MKDFENRLSMNRSTIALGLKRAFAFPSSSKNRFSTCVVNSHNEFDPLEEVIVGSVKGATLPEWHVSGKAVWPEKWWSMYKNQSGQPFPPELMTKASEELDNFAKILEAEGVKVRRPEVLPGDYAQPYSTPDFKCQNGLYAAMPRDILIVVGNEIIEAPMAWRSRFFEYRPFRKLIKEYFRQGAKWTAAPKPMMSDDLYVSEDTVTCRIILDIIYFPLTLYFVLLLLLLLLLHT